MESGQDWFVNEVDKRLINKLLFNKLLLERISLAGICRVCDISEKWLLSYIKALYDALPDDLNADVILPDIEAYLADRMNEEISRLLGIKKIQLYYTTIFRQPQLRKA